MSAAQQVQPEKSTWSKEELFAEIKSLEEKTFALMSDDSQQEEFDRVTDRAADLIAVARNMGWMA